MQPRTLGTWERGKRRSFTAPCSQSLALPRREQRLGRCRGNICDTLQERVAPRQHTAGAEKVVGGGASNAQHHDVARETGAAAGDDALVLALVIETDGAKDEVGTR